MHDNLTRDTNKKIEATPENLLYIFGTDPVMRTLTEYRTSSAIRYGLRPFT